MEEKEKWEGWGKDKREKLRRGRTEESEEDNTNHLLNR